MSKIKHIKAKKAAFISIIIPVERETNFLKEAIYRYSKQTYRNFELLISTTETFETKYKFARIITDKKISTDVSAKRNKILKFGKGEIFIFNDDDVFVPSKYLKNVIKIMNKKNVLAACGPLLTPLSDDTMQKASGAVWESYMGSLGAGIHRSRKLKARTIYDFPAANLIVRGDIFKKIGGFEKKLYPGEDTKLCLLILNQFKKGIYYDPRLSVYHHRKALFIPHLKQIGRYGSQRGWFSLAYPETSFQLQYFFPTIFLLYLVILFLGSFLLYFFKINRPNFYRLVFFPLFVYSLLLLFEGVNIARKKNLLVSILAVIGIILTHLYYGWKFLKSFVKKFFLKLFSFLE